jgi:hypothetical protein
MWGHGQDTGGSTQVRGQKQAGHRRTRCSRAENKRITDRRENTGEHNAGK